MVALKAERLARSLFATVTNIRSNLGTPQRTLSRVEQTSVGLRHACGRSIGGGHGYVLASHQHVLGGDASAQRLKSVGLHRTDLADARNYADFAVVSYALAQTLVINAPLQRPSPEEEAKRRGIRARGLDPRRGPRGGRNRPWDQSRATSSVPAILIPTRESWRQAGRPVANLGWRRGHVT